MPPYWDYSPSYTYPKHTRDYILNFLIISFVFIENKWLSDAIKDLKREKKDGFELGSIALKSACLAIYATETDI